MVTSFRQGYHLRLPDDPSTLARVDGRGIGSDITAALMGYQEGVTDTTQAIRGISL